MGIRSVAAFAWTPFMQMYDTTQDKALLQEKVYPYLRGVVDFYVNPSAGRSYLLTVRHSYVVYTCRRLIDLSLECRAKMASSTCRTAAAMRYLSLY